MGESVSGAGAEAGWSFTLTDARTGSAVGDWTLTAGQLGLADDRAFTVRKRTLAGGRQAGVEVIEVDNGRLCLVVVPTRGMSLYRVDAGDVSLGWESPVTELVHPAHVDLQARGGLGWLDGFNEMLVRCGFEWSGHPGRDGDHWLTLHGRAGNRPASVVEVHVDAAPPHRIRVRGLVREQTFKFADYAMWTEVSTEPGSDAFRLDDTLTNHSDYDREFQLLYHGNVGPPLLEAGARVVVPAARVTPFDAAAAEDRAEWAECRGPTPGYGERVYMVTPWSGTDGWTRVTLHNATAGRGVELRYDTTTLPALTLWKNTDTRRQGYVTGMEPGTGFACTRAVERAFGRVPTLEAGGSRRFRMEYTLLRDAAAVADSAAAIDAIRDGRETVVEEAAPVAP